MHCSVLSASRTRTTHNISYGHQIIGVEYKDIEPLSKQLKYVRMAVSPLWCGPGKKHDLGLNANSVSRYSCEKNSVGFTYALEIKNNTFYSEN